MPKHTTKSLMTYAVVGLLFFGALLFITGADSNYQDPPYAVKAPQMLSAEINESLTSMVMVVTPVPTVGPVVTKVPKEEVKVYVDAVFGTTTRFPQRGELLLTPRDLIDTQNENYMSSSQVASGHPPTEEVLIAQGVLYNESLDRIRNR